LRELKPGGRFFRIFLRFEFRLQMGGGHLRSAPPPPDRKKSGGFISTTATHYYGLSQKETKDKDQQAQAQETHAGEPPQEAFAL
jgi:hypothetical protein